MPPDRFWNRLLLTGVDSLCANCTDRATVVSAVCRLCLLAASYSLAAFTPVPVGDYAMSRTAIPRTPFSAWRNDEQLLATARCLAVLIGVVVFGTLGFHLVEEEWTYWESLYFTLVTITTVGYGDHGISENGEKFAALLLLCGIGTFTYSLTTLVQIASDREATARRKMKHSIAHTTDHVIVCGYGRMGRMVCEEIERGGLSFVVIELSPEGVQQAKRDGRLVITGIASEDETLVAAGIERAQGIVCAVDSDAENMFITVTVRELNPHVRIISRAESPASARKLEHAGASLVISPHQMAGKSIATAFVHPRLTRFLHNPSDEEAGQESCYFELGEIEVQAGAAIEGRTVADFGDEMSGVVFVAIERKGRSDRGNGKLIVQPGGTVQFMEGDIVIFAGTSESARKMNKAAKATRRLEPAMV